MEAVLTLLAIVVVGLAVVVRVWWQPNLPANVCTWQVVNGNVRYPKGTRFAGYDAGTLATCWQESVAPENREQVADAWSDLVSGHIEHLSLTYLMADATGVLRQVHTTADAQPGRPVCGVHVDLGEPPASTVPVNITSELTALEGQFDQLMMDQSLADRWFERIRGARSALGRLSRTLRKGDARSHAVVTFSDLVDEALAASLLRGHRCAHDVAGVRIDDTASLVPLLIDFFAYVSRHIRSERVELTSTVSAAASECAACGTTLTGRWHQLQTSGVALPSLLRRHVFLAGYAEGSETGEVNGLHEVSTALHALGGHFRLLAGAADTCNVQLLLPARARNMSTGPDERAGRILVVDDEPAVATFLSRVLTHLGYDVTTVNDPAQALAQFRDAPFDVDLVITDQSMPGFSGDVLLGAMLELRPDLPVIMCTAFSLEMGDRAARRLGARGYLSKPIEVDELVHLVSESLAPPTSRITAAV